MSRVSSNLRAAAVFSVLTLFTATAAVAAPQTLRVSAPSTLNPIDASLQPVPLPLIFRWTPVASGPVYVLHPKTRRVTAATAPVTASGYELQISDEPGVSSHVLFDTTVNTTSFVFTNQNVPGSGFTDQQPPTIPLAGGTYYWRVRAIAGGAVSPYSQVARFLLDAHLSTTPLHALGVQELTIGPGARSGAATLLQTTVANAGTFPESGAVLTVSVNGNQVARGNVPPLAPGQRVRLAAPWIPDATGTAQLVATIDYVDQMPRDHTLVRTAFIEDARSVRTAIAGTLGLAGSTYVLRDSAGRTQAILERAPGSTSDLESLRGVAVVASGSLTTTARGMVLRVTSITRQGAFIKKDGGR